MTDSISKVKAFLKDNPVCSYAQISKGADIPQSMVSGCLRILIRNKEIIKHSQHNAQGKTLSNRYEVVDVE